MDMKVEHLDNHTAEITVTVDTDRIEAARRKTAKRLAKKLRIPGFRPGKAPYQIVVNYVGEEALTVEAIEDISNDLYRDALDESGIEPYAMGEITDVKLEDGVVLTFAVPKRPTVDLGNYRETLRVEFKEPTVSDEDIEKSLARTQENMALTEEVKRPAAMNDEVIMMSLRGVFVNEDPEAEEEIFINQTMMKYLLLEDDNRDLIPGFSQELVGLAEGDTKSFTLIFAEDEDDEELRGRSVKFDVVMHQVNQTILPVVDDLMADIASDGELKTLEELRAKLREQILEHKQNDTNEAYTEDVIDALVEAATLAYPPAMVEDYLNDLMTELNEYLTERAGMKLEDYARIMDKPIEAIREDNRDRAIKRLQRSLALMTMAEHEKLTVTDDDILEEIHQQATMLGGEHASAFLEVLNTEEHRENTALTLINRKVLNRLTDIAKGLAVDEPAEEAPAADEQSEESSEE